MLSRFFSKRHAQSLPLFAIDSLQLSEKVHWLASKGLIDPLPYVQRHVRGDWGEVDETTRQANTVALDQDSPMISRYRITPHLVLIVVTSEDRKTTLVQLPEEHSAI